MLLPYQRANALSYPYGAIARFDPSHIAAVNARFSAVATRGNFLNLLSNGIGAPTGTPTASIDSRMGPGVGFTGTNVIAFSGQSTAAPANATIASIFRLDSTAGFNSLFTNSGNFSTGISITFTSGSAVPQFWNQNGSANLGSTPVPTGVPVFMIMSGIGGSTVNMLFVRLDTGAIVTATATQSFTYVAPNGTYQIGNNSFTNAPFAGPIGAVAYMENFLSLLQMRQWAQDLWRFWRQTRRVDLATLFSLSSAAAPAFTPYNPWPQAGPILAM